MDLLESLSLLDCMASRVVYHGQQRSSSICWRCRYKRRVGTQVNQASSVVSPSLRPGHAAAYISPRLTAHEGRTKGREPQQHYNGCGNRRTKTGRVSPILAARFVVHPALQEQTEGSTFRRRGSRNLHTYSPVSFPDAGRI